jgi:folate-binding protein YgfZ
MTQPALQADFTPCFDYAALPADYGDVRAEYEAIRHGAALIDLSPAGKLTISGKNAVQFVNGLVSNDVKKLQAGEGVLAAFPTVQGKVAALARIYQLGDSLLLELDASNRAKVFQNLNRFVLAGEFFLTDATESLALFSLQGPRAAELLGALVGQAIDADTVYAISTHRLADAQIHLATHSRTGELGFDLFVTAEAAPRLWHALLTRSAEFGARAVGQAALEVARLEAAIPREPVDVNENYIVNETNLTDAVSYTKGCYLGQEVIARIHWRGQPAKQLKGLLADAPEPPARGTGIWAGDGKKVGEITSSVRSLALDCVIALGYVHRHYLNPGTTFTLKQGEAELGTAQLAETPFVKK